MHLEISQMLKPLSVLNAGSATLYLKHGGNVKGNKLFVSFEYHAAANVQRGSPVT